MTEVVGYTFNADTYCVWHMEIKGTISYLPDISEDDPKPIFSTDEAGNSPDHCCVCGELIENSWHGGIVEYAVSMLEEYVIARVTGDRDKATFNLKCLDAWHERLGQCIVDRHDDWMIGLYDLTRDYDNNG
jgi:hypothetical protein